MESKALRDQKSAPKKLEQIPAIKPMKKNSLPQPFKRMGGSRIYSTGLLDVSADHRVIFVCRDGQLLSDKSFYGYLFRKLSNTDLFPIFEFHWHPNHKGFHCKTPCRAKQDYTNRFLPGAIELNMKTDPLLDPMLDTDRAKLIRIFCDACGIELPPPIPFTPDLFKT